MRIISGSAKGRQIFAPKGQLTRPTQDRVRESLFNILQGRVEGATVLDLFAGSGSLMLEAISRGAEYAVAVDHASSAIACVKRNMTLLGFEDVIQVLSADWRQALKRLKEQEKTFDLIFLDPPYAVTSSDVPLICEQLANNGLLQTDAWVVVEHLKGEIPILSEAFFLRSTRRYGETEISFFAYTDVI